MKIEIHEITACGFYKRGDHQPLFGVISEWLTTFHGWIKNRPNVAATTTFSGEESTIYCADMFLHADGFGIKLWHGTPATESGIAYISSGDRLGYTIAKERKIGKNSIPGWPSYFWIIPKENRIITLQHKGGIRNRSSGIPALRDYLLSYLTKISDFTVFSDDNKKRKKIIGYKRTKSSNLHKNLTPFFKTSQLELPSNTNDLMEQCGSIRKLILSEQLSRKLPVEYSAWEEILKARAWQNFHAPKDQKLNFRIESDWQPFQDELSELIEQFSGNKDRNIKQRIGVRLLGCSTIHWLDTIYAQDQIDISKELENALDWNTKQFKQAWMQARDARILAHTSV